MEPRLHADARPVEDIGSPFPYDGPPALRPVVHDALASVVDPEIALDAVQVGLVYGVSVGEDAVRVRLTTTSAACPMTDMIVEDAEAALQAALPGRRIEIDLVWEPPWTPERLSDEARRFLDG